MAGHRNYKNEYKIESGKGGADECTVKIDCFIEYDAVQDLVDGTKTGSNQREQTDLWEETFKEKFESGEIEVSGKSNKLITRSWWG